ncbi:MAG: PAS domain S-box protein, partial [Acidimicrobiaceae bacterium]|nr:PAS domain S-box protein [Acidimicrobiaceae bacterium]
MQLNGDSRSVDDLLREISELKVENAILRGEAERLSEERTTADVAKSALSAKALEATSEGVWIISPDLKTIDANAAFCKMLGYEKDELLGAPILPFFCPEVQSTFLTLATRFEDDERVIYDTELRHKDGGGVHCQLNVASLSDDSAAFLASCVTVTDLTERLAVEDDLKESKDRLSEILEFLPDATFVIDEHGRVTFWNRAMEELTGVLAEDIVGQGDYEYALPFYGDKRPILIDLVLNPNEDLEAKYSSILIREKTYFAVETTPPVYGKAIFAVAAAIYDSKGRVVGAIESVRDISAHKKAEQSVRESQARLENIISLLPDPTFVIDEHGKVTFWNRAMEELTGVRAEDMIGKGDYEYARAFYGETRPILIDLAMYPDLDIPESYAILDRKLGFISAETYAPALPGGGSFVYGTAAPIYDINGEIVGSIESVRDITDRKRAEDEV